MTDTAPAGARHNQAGRPATTPPVRTVRIADPLWDAVTEEAQRNGVPVAAVVRDALDTYLDRRP